MADEAEDDVLELTEDQQIDGDETDKAKLEPDGKGEDEFDVSFGDEAAPASESDTPLIKHLRSQLREKSKELEEARKSAPQPQKIEVGPKPTLAGCDYDEEAYEQARDEWDERKRQAERAETEGQKVQRQAQEAWQRDYEGYQQKRAALTFPDVEEVEAVATASLDQVQQAVIVRAADNPAQLLYALGKHPAKLSELSAITDPLKLAVAVAKLEGALKVTQRRKAPDPEHIERGSAPVSKGRDATLERLEKKAAQTGERTELIAYRRQQASKGK